MHKTTFLVLLLFAAGGVWVANNWEELQYAAGVEQRPEDAAIEMAKDGFALDRLQSNEDVIHSRLHDLDVTQVLGWDARAFDHLTWVVRFRYREADSTETLAYHFEVNVETENVRNIEDDEELREKYGVPPQ